MIHGSAIFFTVVTMVKRLFLEKKTNLSLTRDPLLPTTASSWVDPACLSLGSHLSSTGRREAPQVPPVYVGPHPIPPGPHRGHRVGGTNPVTVLALGLDAGGTMSPPLAPSTLSETLPPTLVNAGPEGPA